jgi:hypothetical protein
LFIALEIRRVVARAATETGYRDPLVGFASAGDLRFDELRRVVHSAHLLPGARSGGQGRNLWQMFYWAVRVRLGGLREIGIVSDSLFLRGGGA